MAQAARKPFQNVLPESATEAKTFKSTGPVTAALACHVTGSSEDDDAKIRVLRARRRISVQLDAELLSEGRCQSTIVCDVSRYGAGLAGVLNVRKGEFVALRLPGGQIIQGNVRWHHGNRCGIAFFEPLAEDAPLMVAAGIKALCTSRETTVTPKDVAPISLPTRQSLRLWLCSVFAVAWLSNVSRELAVLLRTLRSEANRTQDDRVMERACRRQGFAWLTDEEIKGSPKGPDRT